MKKLRTVSQVELALGGLQGVCSVTGANFKQAWHWTRRAKKFPAHSFVVMQDALQQRGYAAPARLWTMKGPRRAA